MLHLGWSYIHPTAAKDGSVSRLFGAHVLHSISVGFTYPLQQQRTAVLAGYLAPITILHLGRIHLPSTAGKDGSVSRLFSIHVLCSISVGFTYPLQQQRTAVLAGYSAPMCYAPSRSGSLTSYSSKERQRQTAIQHPRAMLHLGRSYLLPAAAKDGSVSRLFSIHVLCSILVGVTYILQQQRAEVLAGYSAPTCFAPSRSDSLTVYSSEGRQC